ncbi:MAG: hypothetical protein H4O13_16140 [Xanthomonadales bacterium]|nr:hypothetical protein [Xanthomonadales bacterium]
MRATLIVNSPNADLAALEAVLGESRLKEHALGTARPSGLIRRQSIWMRDWVVSAEPPTSPLQQIVSWFEEKRPALLALDPDVSVKLSAVADPDGFAVPIDLAEQLFLQRIYLTIDLPQAGEPA